MSINNNFKNRYLVFKEVSDRVLAFILILILLPIYIIISLLIWINLGKPIFFKQMRPGYKGKVFTIIKFRSMRELQREGDNLLSDNDRITLLGDFLRKTSLDELPELFNILIGDMSFVGPRPLLIEYLNLYSSEQMRRHNIKPGLTGWAQVNGRNSIPWEKKFNLDIWYVDNLSFLLDLRIMLITIYRVIIRDSIYSDGKSIPKPFQGNIDSSKNS